MPESLGHALLIANAHYSDPTLNALQGTEVDIKVLEAVLADPAIGGYRVRTSVDESIHTLRQRIERFFVEAPKDGLLLLYLSGHGVKDRDGKLYFAAADTESNFLMSTGLAATFIQEASERSRCRRQVFIFDACFSGAFAKGYTHKSDQKVHAQEAFSGGTGKIIITASDDMQYAWVDDAIEGNAAASVFTRHLVEGLRTGAAANEAENITADRLYQYVYEHVLDNNRSQKPQLWSFGLNGDLILARNPAPKPLKLSTELVELLEDPKSRVRVLGIDELKKLLGQTGLHQAIFVALEKLKDDDSRMVSARAAEVQAELEELQKEAERKRLAEEERKRLAEAEAKRQAEEEQKCRARAKKHIPKIKITMLGTGAAGKTCYLLGMYAHMQRGIEGFTLRAVDLDQEHQLIDRWERLVSEKGCDRWPPLNDRATDNYIFELSHGFMSMMRFDWLDYCGGALMAKSSEKDRQELHNHFISSQVIFLCVSGEHLVNSVDDNTLQLIARCANISYMNWLLNELIKTRDISAEQPFPVVILITKYDKCCRRPPEELIGDIKKIFSALFVNGAGWLVMICPVTLGKNLADDPTNASIDPRNVELPMIFAVYAHYFVPYLEVRARELELENQRWQQERKSGVRRWWDGDDMNQTIASLSLIQDQRKDYEKYLRLAADKLRTVDLFLNGKRMEIDV